MKYLTFFALVQAILGQPLDNPPVGPPPAAHLESHPLDINHQAAPSPANVPYTPVAPHPVITPNGYPAGAIEVVSAKANNPYAASHLDSLANQPLGISQAAPPAIANIPYQSLASPSLITPSGYPVGTPEAVSAKANNPYAPFHPDSLANQPLGISQAAPPAIGNIPYQSLASPSLITPSGYPVGTPEAVSAKDNNHYAASQPAPLVNQPFGISQAAPPAIANIPYQPLASSPLITLSGYPIGTPEAVSAKASNPYVASHAAPLVNQPLGISQAAPPAIANIPYRSLAPPPFITPSGYLADTPVVAAAKAAHLADLARAGDYAWAALKNIPYAAHPFVSQLADAPEVAIAKAAHIAALSKNLNLPALDALRGQIPYSPESILAKAVQWAEQAKGSSLPLPLVLPNPAHVAQSTPAHLADHVKAAALANQLVDQYYLFPSSPAPLGPIQDTPEVAQAKLAHLAAKSAAA